jgi:NadR type nicotinamide-nucleotide adenylyltransferase
MEETFVQRPSDCIKIVLYGPESTGKTTICEALANHFDAPWVPEYMRAFAQRKFDQGLGSIHKEDMPAIATGQLALEKKAAQRANKLLLCDTNLLELLVYGGYYFPEHSFSEIEEAFQSQHYDHYFLTYIDTPWVADDLRDRPNDREKMFCIFEKELRQRNLPHTILTGSLSQRLETAVAGIENLFNTNA